MHKFKGAIFDLDGVLVDTENLNCQAWIEVSKSYDFSFSKKDFAKYAGKQGKFMDKDLIEKFHLRIKKGVLYEEKRKISTKLLREKEIKIMPCVRTTLRFLKKKGLKIAVATGSPKNETLLKLKKTKLFHYFSAIVSGLEVKRGKPYPDSYLLATKKLGFSPKECFAIEDSQAGLESAKSAGLICFVVPSDFSKNQDFSKADKVFPSLKNLVEFLKTEGINQ